LRAQGFSRFRTGSYAKTEINHGRHGQTRIKLKAFRSKSPCLSAWSVISLILLRKVG
jgi:hypothetical protein